MSYEEKLDLIIDELIEARKSSRAGKPTKIFITSQTELNRLIIPQEIHEILLQLQEDEKIIEVLDYPSSLKPAWVSSSLDKIDYFEINIFEPFDSWYANYLLSKKSKLGNLDLINLLKIYDVVLDIEQQIQIDGKITIYIPSLPHLVRFQLLFPIDSVGSRQTYQGYRWEGVKFLEKRDIVTEPKYEEDYLSYGSIRLTVKLLKFNDFLKEITTEYKRRHKETTSSTDSTSTKVIKNNTKIEWTDDFRWEGKNFIFGKYGSIGFKSKDRNHILKALTEKKGDWASLNELQGEKDSSYVRATIKQIEDRLPAEAKEHIKIVSTQDDDTIDKPSTGAYRIRYTPQP